MDLWALQNQLVERILWVPLKYTISTYNVVGLLLGFLLSIEVISLKSCIAVCKHIFAIGFQTFTKAIQRCGAWSSKYFSKPLSLRLTKIVTVMKGNEWSYVPLHMPKRCANKMWIVKKFQRTFNKDFHFF